MPESPERKHPPTDPLLQWFEFKHLRDDQQAVSAHFSILAEWLVNNLPPSAERTVALRKLLESKDAAVRASLVARE